MNAERLVLLGMLKEAMTGVAPVTRGRCEGLIARLIDMESETKTPVTIKEETQNDTQENVPTVDHIVFFTRGDAESFLNDLNNIVTKYGQASVADYYDLAGFTSDYRLNEYGWLSVKGATIWRFKGGYKILLEDPVRL